MYRYFFLFLLLSPVVQAQSLTEPQQKALLQYMEVANRSAEEVIAIGKSVQSIYADVNSYKKDKHRRMRSYTCPSEFIDDIYLQAVKNGAALGASNVSGLTSSAKAVNDNWKRLDEKCKALEIYFRLEDYQRDDFKGFDALITEVVSLIAVYRKSQDLLADQTEKVFYKLQPHNNANANHVAAKLMREQIKREKAILDLWTCNLEEGTHTGWPVEKIQQHVLENDKQIEKLKASKPTLKYPASSMYPSFIEGLESLQQTKRNGIDEYTYEKRASDKHSNDVYLGMINYYNGVLISDINTFSKFASQDAYRGLYAAMYVPGLEIRGEKKEIKLEVVPFQETNRTPFTITPVATPISKSTHKSLTNYVEYINEGLRQIHNMLQPMRNLNGSVVSGKVALKEGRKASLYHYYKDFQVPVTLYQQTKEETNSLQAAYQKPLIGQLDVLQSILNEINQWNNSLLAAAAEKQLTKDSLDFAQNIVKRYAELSVIFDLRKEQLYKDVRSIYDSYKLADSKSSWVVSGGALLNQINLDREELFKAKEYFLGDSAYTPLTQKIDEHWRALMVNEFNNLKGIQKLGRYNGNCPYSPYEDIAEYSRLFSEKVSAIKTKKVTDPNRHPYNELIYTYNQSLSNEYNRFAELSPVPLLKVVQQSELFIVRYPDLDAVKKRPAPLVQPEVQQQMVNPEKHAVAVDPSGRVIHDTVRITDIIRIETVRQDTIYIEKRDTVYLSTPGENFMSMEGYATNNMVLLLDVSGSMNNPEKLPLLKKSVLLLLKMMRPEDEVSIVIFSGKAKVALQPISFKEEEKIKKVIEQLKSEGKTDGNAGVKLAYTVADGNYIRGGNNRIILATDGEFPVSEETFDLVKKFSGEDIFISVFNFGKTTQSAKNLQRLTSAGKGNYEYITRENVDTKLVREAKAKRKK
ncbi:MAG TPA: VWA domain-containing protein [Cyclobacteriaceae bacterium]|nr:VWA domain-containing protein [Cyclobacteriaceae bacterium]